MSRSSPTVHRCSLTTHAAVRVALGTICTPPRKMIHREVVTVEGITTRTKEVPTSVETSREATALAGTRADSVMTVQMVEELPAAAIEIETGTGTGIGIGIGTGTGTGTEATIATKTGTETEKEIGTGTTAPGLETMIVIVIVIETMIEEIVASFINMRLSS